MNKTKQLKGRIIANHLTKYIAKVNEDTYSLEISGRFKYLALHKSDYPVVGDFVNFHETEEFSGIIESIDERQNKLSRLANDTVHNEQIIASNIDVVFVCLSMNDDFHIRKLNNFLRIAHHNLFETVVLLTKSDLCEDQDYYVKQVQYYTNDQIETVSVYHDDDIKKIKSIIGTKTAIFIGSSGVGKSTIINKLLNQDHFKTNDIRESDAQGRHTTVHKELVFMDNGGAIIDSPGIRIVNAYHVDDLEDEFEEVTSLSKECKFNDCTHTNEPGCKVKEALQQGSLDDETLYQYNKALRFNRFVKRQERVKQRLQEKRKKYSK